MELLPQSFIDDVLSRVDIADVVGKVVQLKKSGGNFFGLCPFHGEKSPSFSVTPAKQFFHCFGCGKNGNAIMFLQEHAGLSFREAVEELAHSVGMVLPTQSPLAAQQAAEREAALQRLVTANQTAWAFFRHCLIHTAKPKDYLKSRSVPAEATNQFMIGYAPPEWQGLEEAFPDYRTNKALEDTGLVVVTKEGRRYDRFRDRLMFGIRDPRGRLIGFGGRELDGSEAKYLNSPESLAFDKGSVLFGVYEARDAIRTTGRVIVTEGYLDTVAHAMNGLAETVCSMGTACTGKHVERLMALAKETIYAFDGDAAGRKAAWRALEASLPQADDVHTFRFLMLPDGFDPDELILKEGAEAYRARVNAALPLSTFLMLELAQRHNQLATPENRAGFVREGMAMISRLPYGTRLYRFLKQEVERGSQLTHAEFEHLARRPVQAAAAAAPAGAWEALAAAAKAQPATAMQHAEPVLDLLEPRQQDAFFALQFDAFGPAERPFWMALSQAVCDPQAQDTESDVAAAQRSLLARCTEVIPAERARSQQQQLLERFRRGEVGGEELLRSTLPGERA
ncbi:DNA primase [Ramlibacter sp. AN1133]|uniref:DNA primase n=1 Tax=Ramlibacter sp. AN1133 TaxID=3133429 RepID=UPI0030C4E5AC